MPIMIAELDSRNPYPGPRPFEPGEQKLFFGRGREVSELLSLIVVHRVVLLYAQSGAGKTSLLNAGLIPLLIEEGFEILPVARVRGLIPGDMELPEKSNVYVFNTLMGWAEDGADPKSLVSMSIATFLKEHAHPVDEQGLPSPRVVIFDQFEELLAFYPECREDREDFFHQVAKALEEDPLLRVLFVIREDCLTGLDPYADLLPDRLRTRFRLEHLRAEAAHLAIEGPLRGTDRSFAEGVASRLVQELLKIRVESVTGEIVETTGEYVEPVQLQVVCQSLWLDLPPDVEVITSDHLQTLGDVNEILKDFYERAVKTTVKQTSVKEGDLRTWFDRHLITPAGTRGTVFQGQEHTGGIPNAAVDVLRNQYLIRAELRAGARWYELTHDRFIEPIQESNQKWFTERREAEQTRQQLETKAAEWVRLGRGRDGLLDEVELLEAERWLNILDTTGLGYSEDVPALMEASRAAIEEAEREKEAARRRELVQAHALAEEQQRRAEEQTKTARRLRRLAVALAIVLLLTVGALLFVITERNRVEQQAQEAVVAQKDAEQVGAETVETLRIAEERRKEAEQAREAAEAARAEAEAERNRAEQQAQAAVAAQKIAEEQWKEAEQAREAAEATRAEAEAERSRAEQQAQAAVVAQKDAEQARAETVEALRIAEERRQEAEQAREAAEVARAEAEAERNQAEQQAQAAVAAQKEAGQAREETVEALRIAEEQRMEAEQAREAAEAARAKAEAERNQAERLALEALASRSRGVAAAAIDNLNTDPELSVLLALYAVSLTYSFNKTVTTEAENVLYQAVQASRIRLILFGHTDKVRSVTFSPDGTRLTTASRDGTAKVWDAFSGQELLTLFGHTNRVRSVAFSPDGTRLATASWDGTVKVWDATSGKELLTLPGHTGGANGVAFSPDGARLATAASGNEDETAKVKVWDSLSGQELFTLSGHEDRINGVAFSP
ncbi:MAG: WD40 repeat domain-containing protein, partial [Acidobacteriota bacterium]